MKRILREFQLDKIAVVDRPCQEGALMCIMKRDNSSETALADLLVKQLIVLPISNGDDDDDGFEDFDSAYEDVLECARECDAKDQLRPLFCALKDSFVSISLDTSLDGSAKAAEMRNSVEQFLAELRGQYPTAPSQLEMAIKVRKGLRTLNKRLSGMVEKAGMGGALGAAYGAGASGSKLKRGKAGNAAFSARKSLDTIQARLQQLRQRAGALASV